MAKEYIEKEAFKQYLRDLKKQVNDILPGQSVISGTTLAELIDRFPAAADVVEVVRCKDCLYGHRYFDVRKERTDSWVECRLLGRDVSDDGYCYYGVRKDE